MGDYIVCRSCESPYCRGCNLKRLEIMLGSGKFDSLMNENRAINILTDISTVRHGHWRNFYKSGIKVDKGVVSSCCDMWNERASPYCPHCGAKMDAHTKCVYGGAPIGKKKESR